MSYEMEAARRYRNHAEELRTIASGDGYHKTQKMLLSVASDYERMAGSLQAIEETNLQLNKRRDLR